MSLHGGAPEEWRVQPAAKPVRDIPRRMMLWSGLIFLLGFPLAPFIEVGARVLGPGAGPAVGFMVAVQPLSLLTMVVSGFVILGRRHDPNPDPRARRRLKALAGGLSTAGSLVILFVAWIVYELITNPPTE
jgi:hypothetical protein